MIQPTKIHISFEKPHVLAEFSFQEWNIVIKKALFLSYNGKIE